MLIMLDTRGAFLTRRQVGTHGKHPKVVLVVPVTLWRPPPFRRALSLWGSVIFRWPVTFPRPSALGRSLLLTRAP